MNNSYSCGWCCLYYTQCHAANDAHYIPKPAKALYQDILICCRACYLSCLSKLLRNTLRTVSFDLPSKIGKKIEQQFL